MELADDDEVVVDEWLDVEDALAWLISTEPIPAVTKHMTVLFIQHY